MDPMKLPRTTRGDKEISQEILDEIKQLREKELEILSNRGMEVAKFDPFNQISEGYLYISKLDLNAYPEYLSKFIDYMIEHVHVGDYVPSGCYVDEAMKVIHFVSISDQQVYSYPLD